MKNNLEKIRHSLAHIMAYAAQELWPKVKIGMGPAINDGFYYDFDFVNTDTMLMLSIDDLKTIQKKMVELIGRGLQFEQKTVSIDEARKLFAKQIYKLEILDDLAKQGEREVSIYKCGDFIDLCKGPHIKSTKELNSKVFKLDRISGAYWKGDEKNKQLQRIYGLAFATPKELRQYEAMMKEAAKRDHRRIGREMDLFAFSNEVGPGLPLWLPKGTIICDELEKWAKQKEKKEGYVKVKSPHITKAKLYEISGHLPYYKDDMYAPMKTGEGDYYLKPMNCPHHHMIYKARPKSYKDLPLRFAEYGIVYRYEKSGELYGLMRVRKIDMNDAHIYCTLDQAKEEFIKVIKLHEYYYKKLGLKDYYMELALRDPKDKKKYHGDEKMWQTCEKIVKTAMEESKIPYVIKKGEAAFYGPKIDFIIKAVTGREFGASTNQLDLYMGKQFGLEYIDDNGQKQAPAIIHRAPLGSHERFIGFLIEHFAGNFPVWLAPTQVLVISVSDKFVKGASELVKKFEDAGIRVELDKREESVGKKIADSRKQRIPYTIVFGAKEEKSRKLFARKRDGKVDEIEIDVFIKKVKETIDNKFINC